MTNPSDNSSSSNSNFDFENRPAVYKWLMRMIDRLKGLAVVRGFLAPVWRFLGRIIGGFRRWFQWVAFQHKDGQLVLNANDARIFSPQRFITLTTLSVLSLFVLHASLAALYFYTTQFSETVYITGKQEIETGELYQFGGCTSLPCSTASDNGKFYLIESSLYFPRMFYPEENVFANIPQQNGACTVEGYGLYFRSMRWLYKSAQLYQHVYNVSCRPFTEPELQRAVSGGEIR